MGRKGAKKGSAKKKASRVKDLPPKARKAGGATSALNLPAVQLGDGSVRNTNLSNTSLRNF
jgi:hypothetical protein